MNRKVIVVTALSFLGGFTGCATTRSGETLRTEVDQEAVVTVEAIDVPARLVTVRNAGGQSVSYYVHESVTNFPQAKVGDRVRIRFRESYAFRLLKPGDSATAFAATAETDRAQPGGLAGHTAAEVKATVRIEDVSADGRTVTFTGPRGHRRTHILDPALQAYVKKLHKGDLVEVTYQEALALSLIRVTGT